MTRVNLKELKDALNKLPDDKLESLYLTHDMCTEEPQIRLDFVFYEDEEDYEKMQEIYGLPEFKVLNHFRDDVWDDAKKVMICKIDEDKMDDYLDDTEWENQ